MTEIFDAIDLSDTAPPGVCSKCAKQGMEHTPTGAVFAYCRHTETGAMRSPGSAWIEATHISAKDFKAALLQAVLEGERLFIDAQIGDLSEQ